jgi:hypothetical protein
MKKYGKWIILAIVLIVIAFFSFKLITPAQAGDCAKMMEGEENLKFMKEEHKHSTSEPTDGVVFAVCIFAIAEDGSRVLVDHRASADLMDCLKNKRVAERDYRDPEKRNKMYPGSTVFTMTCDKVDAKVRIKEDGTWEILDILGRHEPAYREKKSYE